MVLAGTEPQQNSVKIKKQNRRGKNGGLRKDAQKSTPANIFSFPDLFQEPELSDRVLPGQ